MKTLGMFSAALALACAGSVLAAPPPPGSDRPRSAKPLKPPLLAPCNVDPAFYGAVLDKGARLGELRIFAYVFNAGSDRWRSGVDRQRVVLKSRNARTGEEHIRKIPLSDDTPAKQRMASRFSSYIADAFDPIAGGSITAEIVYDSGFASDSYRCNDDINLLNNQLRIPADQVQAFLISSERNKEFWSDRRLF